MHNKKHFIKASECLNFKHSVLAEFYQKLIEFMAEYYKPSTDWKKMMEIEEKFLWPVLRGLGDPTLPIYEGAREEIVNEFTITIRDEIATRMNVKSLSSRDYFGYLRTLSIRRIEFFEKILDITPSDRNEFRKESSWIKWAVGGAITVATIGIVKKTIAYKSSNKADEKK